MKLNDICHGFKIERVRRSRELGGTLYEMRHLKSGAELIFLDNKEVNKLFSVTFKTLPFDDTGVFHILEHSVLSGSEKYPVKEPFLDLLKGSMNTFLNAMTFSDKTMFPVSSRNEKDFLNLTKVYLDAVFCPAIYTNESIFMQEGWHLEFDEEGAYFNGVVYNEMKGEFGSVDSLLESRITKHLFPESIYGFESGGDPVFIPDLTYENFIQAHKDYYTPSNAKIYLDGDVPIDDVLRLIDEEYLSHYEPSECKPPIALQKPIKGKVMKEYYSIGKEEEENNKSLITLSKIFATWQDRKRIMAFSLLASYLAGENESPLKRAILEKGLAENVEFSVTDGIAQPYYTLVFRNTDLKNKDEIWKTYHEVIENILNDGIDKEELSAILNQMEFSLREPEEPKGLTRNINLLASWLYGGDPMLYLENNDVISQLREAINSDYYADILNELLDFSGVLNLNLLPSKTKEEENSREEDERALSRFNSLSEKEQQLLYIKLEKMTTWQDTLDSPEASATLPVLKLSDVSEKPLWTDTELIHADGFDLMLHKLDTNGIVHGNLFFDISDEDCEALCKISMLTALIGVLPTEKHTSSGLQKLIRTNFGSLDFNIDSVPDKEDARKCKLYFTVNFSVLKDKLSSALMLICELLTQTDYSNKDIIYENLLQGAEDVYRSLLSNGDRFAVIRALRPTSALAFADDKVSGFDFYCRLEDFVKKFDDKIDLYIEYLKKRTEEIFTLSRLTAGITCDDQIETLPELTALLPLGNPVNTSVTILPEAPQKEYIVIPSAVSYVASGANIKSLGYDYGGKNSVIALLLTYGYLWDKIRVHGGAYGCGFRSAQNGNAAFYSYRDPHPLSSLRVYRNTADYIAEFINGEEMLDRYIIATVAATEGLFGTARQGFDADINYLSGYTYEMHCKIRNSMLSMNKEDLLLFYDMFNKMKDNNSVCIVGDEEKTKDLNDEWTIYHV